jgi:hypothetical protein
MFGASGSELQRESERLKLPLDVTNMMVSNWSRVNFSDLL